VFVESLRDRIEVGVEQVGVDVKRDCRASVAKLACPSWRFRRSAC